MLQVITMTTLQTLEVYTAGCPLCDDALALVRAVAGDAQEVTVRNLNEPTEAARARSLGIRAVPAVILDGELLDCCAADGVTEASLHAALAGDEAEPASGGCCG